jgi:hypothetical protein
VFAGAVLVPEEAVAGFAADTAGDGVTVCCVGCGCVFCVAWARIAWALTASGAASRLKMSVEQKRFI